MYSALLFRLDLSQTSLLRCVHTFQTCMVWIAITIILQQIIQYTIGNRFWPNLDALLPKAILVGDFMYLRPVAWRSPYLVSQGIFTLEPSVASGFLATAVTAGLAPAALALDAQRIEAPVLVKIANIQRCNLRAAETDLQSDRQNGAVAQTGERVGWGCVEQLARLNFRERGGAAFVAIDRRSLNIDNGIP